MRPIKAFKLLDEYLGDPCVLDLFRVDVNGGCRVDIKQSVDCMESMRGGVRGMLAGECSNLGTRSKLLRDEPTDAVFNSMCFVRN